jgi:hypothetical protein
MTRASGLIALIVLIASPAPLVLPPRCFQGEHWDVSIKALGVTGALARVDVDSECGTQPVHVRASVETTRFISFVWRIQDTLETLLDQDGRSVSTSYNERENGRVDTRVDRYGDGKVTTQWTTPGKARTLSVEAPADTRDPFTVLMLLRGARLATGEVHQVPIFSKDAVYQGTITVVGRGRLTFMDRDVAVIHLLATFLRDGKPSRVHTDIYLTDDARRLPVRVEAGTRYGYLVGELTGVSGVPPALTTPAAWQ